MRGRPAAESISALAKGLKWRMVRFIWLAAMLAIFFVLGHFTPAQAQDGEPAGGDPASLGPANVASPFAVLDDGGKWELGLEGSAGNLPQATAAERYGMRYWLEPWFATRFNFNEATAWEEDFKRSDLGGTENAWLDSVDLGFYVGHGSAGRFTFSNAAHDDGALVASGDCNASWGDNDNEWLALTSCKVLSDPGVAPMAYCMNKQHLILGFVTNASAHNSYWETQAYHYGWRLRYGWSQTQAWFGACDVADRGRTVRVIAEEMSCFDDSPYFQTLCADTLDSDYYWYTHDCGTESATQVPLSMLGGQLPVFKVEPYTPRDAAADFTRLATAFQVPVTPTLESADMLDIGINPPTNTATSDFYVSFGVSSTLSMDKGSGLYQFTDNADLWSAASITAAMSVNAASPNLITPDDARRIADDFLIKNGLMEDDAVFFEVVSDSIGSLPTKTPEIAASVITSAEVPANYQVIYTRKLPIDVVTASGVTTSMSVTVVGPGSKLKVYMPLQVPAAAAAVSDTQPIGAVGGWRDVALAVDAASQAMTTTLINTSTAVALFLALDDEVSMNSIPALVQNPQVISTTIAYWEMVTGAQQGELIPVYEFDVSYTDGNTGAAEHDLFYVPASSQYMRPLARILSAPATTLPGVTITLNAADAALTLEQNGIGNSGQFPFTMGYKGSSGVYTYQWYLGSPDPANQIGACDNLRSCEVTAPAGSDNKSGLEVTLVVADSDSPNKSEATASVTILTPPIHFLPAVRK